MYIDVAEKKRRMEGLSFILSINRKNGEIER